MIQSEVYKTLAERSIAYDEFPIICESEQWANDIARDLSVNDISRTVYEVVKVASSEAPWLVIQHEDTVFSNETKTGSYLEGNRL